MTRHSVRQQVKEALQIARDNNLLVVEKAGKYMIYRCMPTRNVLVGMRGSPESMCTFVRKATRFS